MKSSIFLSLSLCLLSALSRVQAMDQQVEKQGGFIIKKINPTLYSAQKVRENKEPLYFAMEEVNSKTYDFWKNFVDLEVAGATSTHCQTHSSRTLDTVNHGASYFGFPLSQYNKHEVWVSYMSEGSSEDYGYCLYEKNNQFPESIVMAMTVSSDKDIPFTTHMGVFKTVEYTLKHKEKFKNTSFFLHCFAAKISKEFIFSEKEYMAITPAPQMRNILMNALPEDSYFIGTKSTFKKWREDEEKDLNLHKTKEALVEKVKLEHSKKEIKKLFPKGMKTAKEPPLELNKDKWTFTLKSGTIVEFTPTSINKKQSEHRVPWMFIDLDKLSK
jgi:hypothetical protein